jgi:HK97 family phage major capsid protein
MMEKFRSDPIQFTGVIADDAILGVSIATTGEAQGHRLLFDETSLTQLQQLGASKTMGIKSRFTHPDWLSDGLGKYLGRVRNFRVDGSKLVGDLMISKTAHSSPAGDIGRYVLDLAREDPSSFGVSVVVDLERVWVTSDGQELPATGGKPTGATGKYPVARITQLYAADVVDDPALNPNGLFNVTLDDFKQLLTDQEYQELFDVGVERVRYSLQPDGVNPKGEKQTMEENELLTRITELEGTVSKLTRTIEDGVVQIGNQPPRGQSVGADGIRPGQGALAEFQGYFDWLFGVPGAKLPPPELRRADALYRAVTGDIAMHGVFDPTHVAFAAANTTTLSDLAVNAMNKVVLDLYTNLTAYRWYEAITAVQATDGTLQDMQWLQLAGLTNLPVVAEGAAYTELAISDTKETSAFYKYGAYVGITDKMIRNSRIDQMQAIPRSLTISAIRTRSAAIAAIFTQASGTGPTLAQDSTVLFHANHGSNVQTTAYSWTAWKAARLECMKQAELGSSKRQVLLPKYLLVPADLYDQTLIDFGYGAGLGGRPGTGDNDVNPYAMDRPGDPRVVPVLVPDWTNVTNWAYIVDPRIAPVICMAYGDNPGGTTHPAPQLYSATDPSSGLLFTNDTLPIKVRDYFAYGVATWRGIGKRNAS